MQRREALAAMASALTGAGCLRLQEAGSQQTRTLRPTQSRTETVTQTGTATETATETQTETATETATETPDKGPPVTGLSRSFAYDAANTGFYGVSGPTEKPEEVWTHSFSDAIRTVPALIDGILYVAADGLTTFDARKGKELWSTSSAGRVSPSVEDGLVYGADYGSVKAFDADSGGLDWSASSGRPNGVTVAGGTVVAGTDDGVIALEAESGDGQWSALSGVSVDTAPAIANGTVYVADRPRDRPSKLYALDLASGTRQWTYQVGEQDGSGSYYYVIGEPVFRNGTVYLACENRVAYAVDAETGEEIWQTTTTGGMNPAPAVTEEYVYVGNDGGQVLALDRTTGEVQWEAREGTGSVVSNVVATQKSVFAVDDSGLLVAYDRSNGGVRYKLGLTRSRTRSGPLVTNDWIFVGDGDGTLHAFTTGN
ncbi:PQQ-binding-like beta-propeller repeat protein [Haloarchaeobius sp. HME9146]|uniref:outer membrane protein assembly factor BamB family protein n=1 Tax=Haloarchaeobius sp. HME9146 TaxID=2978732 RepID=UPI0021C0FB1E|nr:PQQ-binding-like beta-propeller repeat protein [Haloarchaeobius sp. HME9146]MCT9096363.1 PQQ-binding-like beta-propeller repeat protein [Haloarchaeobius sp. HME9146]